jgi:hypothetical protein
VYSTGLHLALKTVRLSYPSVGRRLFPLAPVREFISRCSTSSQASKNAISASEDFIMHGHYDINFHYKCRGLSALVRSDGSSVFLSLWENYNKRIIFVSSMFVLAINGINIIFIQRGLLNANKEVRVLLLQCV